MIDPRSAIGRNSSHATWIRVSASPAFFSFSETSAEVFLVMFSTSMISGSSSRDPVQLARRKSRSSCSSTIFALYSFTSVLSLVRSVCSSGFSFCTTLSRSWSSRPFIVTVKSMIVTFAESSGVKCGFGSRVVMYSLNLSGSTSHSLSASATMYPLPFFWKALSSTGSSTGSRVCSTLASSIGFPNPMHSSRKVRNILSLKPVSRHSFAASLFLIHWRPCPWGSTMIG
mmetsp:Transcript_20364/g.49241  ORF Transcript_20364/g.49241 Transcript_20364/m.49241 type:complete len:228 (+) Transcript_20364:545-1228(+)